MFGAVADRAPYLPYRDGPGPRSPDEFRWRLGLRPLAEVDWIEFGPEADELIAAKPELMADHPDVVFASIDDGIIDESNELAAMIEEHLAAVHPERDASIDRALHPLDAAARLVPDDLVLLVERAGRLIFGGGSVCFPNRWDLRSKLSLTMAEVHAPVPRLNDQLARPIDDALGRLDPARSFWRLGWTLIDTPDHFTPVASIRTGPAEHAAPDEFYVRVERETLRRLPRTGAIVFTIRTYVTPVPAVVASGGRAELAAAVGAWPGDVLAYKGLASAAAELVRHLEEASPDPDII
ncbi:MAG: DUF3445 domain-containing protein [Actinomycetota bacterium]